MQVTPHVYVCHVDQGNMWHPGGSNNYFVGDPTEEMVLIDVGEPNREWTHQILRYYEELGRPKIAAIAITHGHTDHYGGLARIHDVMKAPVCCHPKLVKTLWPLVGKDVVTPLRSLEVLRIGKSVTLQALFTPGHAEDHVCFYLPQERVLFTGDTVLGSSSSAIEDLFAYMKSLKLLSQYRHEIICPAHGAVVPAPRGRRLVQWYINHRNQREEQVLGALERGLTQVDEIVRDVYPRNLKRGLREGAARNVRTHLKKLMEEGRVERVEPKYRLRHTRA